MELKFRERERERDRERERGGGERVIVIWIINNFSTKLKQV